MNNTDLLKLDASNMFAILKDFPEQVKTAIEIGRNAPPFKEKPASNNILVLGMGGSAIGGDILRSFLAATPGANHLSITVNRGYNIPGYVDSDTNVIASSYSGSTEETLTALESAGKITGRIAAITSGGTLQNVAKEKGYPLTMIPGGLQPRCALGSSFFPILHIVMKSGFLGENVKSEINASLDELQMKLNDLSKIYSDMDSQDNEAMKIASGVTGKIPLVYSSYERLDSVNLRWRCQFQENAKNPAFGGLLPEMNHNEINAFDFPADIIKRLFVFLLTDPDDHPKIKTRFRAIDEILAPEVAGITNLSGKGKYLLTRMFELIYLGDWVSFYTALNNGCDPTPIPVISRLKTYLSKQA